MLSELGKRMFFPKGIPAQSAEASAKAKRHDATIGIVRENGKPMFLPSIMKYFNDLTPGETLTYAPCRPSGPAKEMARGNDPEESEPGRARAFRCRS